jgi:hypothetical protein
VRAPAGGMVERNGVIMRLLAMAVLLVPAAAWADPIPPCLHEVRSPHDGATNVPLNIQPVVADSGCFVSTFVDDTRATVEVTRVPQGDGTVLLKPTKPLDAGRTYVIDLGALPTNGACTDPRGTSTFHTGGAPTVAGLNFVVDGLKLAIMDVVLSEPVADVTDLLPSSGFLTVERVSGTTLTARGDSSGATIASRSFKFAPPLPPTSATFHIHVKHELAFASGVAMAGDFDLDVVPKDFPFGWKPGAVKSECPSNSSFGCATAGGGIAAIGLLFARRRRRAVASSPDRRA